MTMKATVESGVPASNQQVVVGRDGPVHSIEKKA